MRTTKVVFAIGCLLLASVDLLMSQGNSNDPVLMTIGDTKVTLSEFSNVYHKNNTREENTQESLKKYLDLFTNFKLKVKEAQELQLDTATAFKEELKGYRKQLSQPYLTDKDVNEKLIKEAYDRLQTDVRASHILIKAEENALPKDTLEAYNKILKIRERIVKGGEDFSKVAKEVSQDPSVKDNSGDLGYFTALQMVYSFENAAYNTPPGNVSMPVRTKFGYHIIKVVGKRPASGDIQVAHIMIKTGEKITAEDSIKAKTKADELYEKIKKGEDFAELAKTYSDDKTSGSNGGQLEWFRNGRFPFEFEEAAHSLKNKGDYTSPIKTKYGWHIIKLIDVKAMAAYDNMKGELKGKISKDSRSQIGKSSLIAKIKKEYQFKENLKARDEFYKVIDTSLFEGKWTADKAKTLNKTMFNLLSKNYTQTDFAKYLESHQSKRAKADIKITVNTMYKQFVDETCIAFEETRLEEKYPEFKALMQEYKEGILLFELTDKKVWSKAVKDTTGLKEYYEKNKGNYLWEERADVTIYTCADANVAKNVRKLLAKNKSEKDILKEVNKTSQLNAQAENKILNKGENKMVDSNWTPGISADAKTEQGKITFVVVHKLLKPQPKKLEEAKGMVTSDYQNYLEKEWISTLKKKYKLEVHKEVLSGIK